MGLGEVRRLVLPIGQDVFEVAVRAAIRELSLFSHNHSVRTLREHFLTPVTNSDRPEIRLTCIGILIVGLVLHATYLF